MSESSVELNQEEARRVLTSSTDYVMFDNKRVPIHDVLAAYGGTMNVSPTLRTSRKFGNPSPMGLCGFALTTFVLSLCNLNVMGIEINNVFAAPAWFYGGLVQFSAGMWEIVLENTFGATVLGAYGLFWMSLAAIETPGFGIAAAYAHEEPEVFSRAFGFYLMAWAIFTLMLWSITLKSTVGFSSLFFLVFVTFLMLAIGALVPNKTCTQVGGGFGVAAAIVAWYNALAGVATKENSYITVTPIYLPGGKPEK